MLAHVVRENTAQQGTGIDNGPEWSNGTVHFDRTGPTGKSGLALEVGRSFRNFSGRTEPKSVKWKAPLVQRNVVM